MTETQTPAGVETSRSGKRPTSTRVPSPVCTDPASGSVAHQSRPTAARPTAPSSVSVTITPSGTSKTGADDDGADDDGADDVGSAAGSSSDDEQPATSTRSARPTRAFMARR